MSTPTPAPRAQREALEQVGKEGQREAARQLQGRRDRRQGGRDSADRARQAADPRPRLVTVEGGPDRASRAGQLLCKRSDRRTAAESLLALSGPARLVGSLRFCPFRATPDSLSTRPSPGSGPCGATRPGRAVPDTPLALDPEARDGVTAAFGGPGNDLPPLLRPMMRGEGGIQFRATTSFLDGHVQARFGVAVRAGDDHPWTFDESSISAPLGAGRIYASVERRHWGPSWTGSLILDAGARPLPGDRLAQGRRPAVPPTRRSAGSARGAPTLFIGQLDQQQRPGPAVSLRRALPVHADRRARAGDLADDAVGRQRPARVGELALSRAHRPGQRRPRATRTPSRATSLPATTRATPIAGRRRAQRLDLRPGDRRGRGQQPAEPLSRQRRRRSRRCRSAARTCASSSSTRTRRPATPSASRSSARAYRHHIYTDGYTPARRSARPSGLAATPA